jgi:DedD protein
MADPIADNAELIVDEMKRKARRRLVGAIVLALAAAIVLPMLLEKEPRPLGDDVSVQIPPVEEGKFVNRPNGKAGDAKPAPRADGKADAKNAGGKSAPRPETAVEAISPSRITLPPVPAPRVAESDEPAAPKKSAAEAERQALLPSSKPTAKTEGNPEPAPEGNIEPRSVVIEPKPATAESKPDSGVVPSLAANAAAAARDGGFVVQLAAFADDKGANSLANKLKKGGYSAYVEPVSTSRGTLWRVRVGGYGSRPEADAARAKLKGEGFSGIVAPAT